MIWLKNKGERKQRKEEGKRRGTRKWGRGAVGNIREEKKRERRRIKKEGIEFKMTIRA